MKNEVNRALAAEKKQYILPSTTTVAFQVAGLICAGSPTRTIGGPLTGGGQTPGGVEPM